MRLRILGLLLAVLGIFTFDGSRSVAPTMSDYVLQQDESVTVRCNAEDGQISLEPASKDTVDVYCVAETAVITATSTITPTATNTAVPPTSTNTPLPTATNTAEPTSTNTPLPTATNTAVPTSTNTPLPTATNTVEPTITPTTDLPPQGEIVVSKRGRVQIVNNVLVAENGYLLTGEHNVVTNNTDTTNNEYTYAELLDMDRLRSLRDDYHLNTIRLLISRPPQNWTSIGMGCWYPVYRCHRLTDADFTDPNGVGDITTIELIDEMVNRAAKLGMYIVIDYHPVGGHDATDAELFWGIVAPRYAERTHVIYEAANEPANGWKPETYTAEDIAFQEAIYQFIRERAPETHIILWSFAEATGHMLSTVNQAAGIDYTNASVGFHPYHATYSDANVLALKNSYPVIATEIGGDRVARWTAVGNLGISRILLDGTELVPGNPTDVFGIDDVTWPKDPDAVDIDAPPATSTPTAVPTVPQPTPTNTPSGYPVGTPLPTATPIGGYPVATNTPVPTAVPTDEPPTEPVTSFDGNTCIASPELDAIWNGDWSIDVDVYLNQQQERQPILSKQGQSLGQRGFWFGTDAGELYLEIYHTQTTSTEVIGPVIPLSQWVQLRAEFESGVATLFVDGSQVAQETAVPAMRQNDLTTQTGCYEWNWQWQWHFDGDMRGLSVEAIE